MLYIKIWFFYIYLCASINGKGYLSPIPCYGSNTAYAWVLFHIELTSVSDIEYYYCNESIF